MKKIIFYPLASLFFFLSCQKEQELKYSTTQLLENQTSRFTIIQPYSWDNPEKRFYVYGKIKNSGDVRGKDYEVCLKGPSNKVFHCTKLVFGGAPGNHNFLEPGEEAWFRHDIEGDSISLDSFSFVFEWTANAERTFSEGELLIPVDSIFIEKDDLKCALSGKVINSGLVNVRDIYVVVAALDAEGNIVHIFNFKPPLPNKTNYCYDGENMKLVLLPGDELKFTYEVSDWYFPYEKVKSFEARVAWVSDCKNLSPVVGQAEFVARTQTNGACATFQRNVNGTKNQFFTGCGFSYDFRGFNITLIDPSDGSLLDFKTFDTWLSETADERMVEYISQIPQGTIVLLAVADESTLKLSPTNQQIIADKLHSTLLNQLSFRDGIALITKMGTDDTIEAFSDYSANGNQFIMAEVKQTFDFPQ